MALKKVIGLAALGGFLYAHKKRGGQLTMDSFRDTARSLFSDAKQKARELRSEAEQKLDEARREMRDVTPSSSTSTSRVGDDVTGYGTSGYGYGTDINRR